MTPSPLPRHVAIIMDGNGRWAADHGLPRTAGHEKGAESVRRTVRACGELGIGQLTLYSFSTENWSRPEDEIEALMGLLAHYLVEARDELVEKGVRLNAIGQLDRLPPHVGASLQAVREATAGNDKLILTLALSYGGRTELVDAFRAMARKVEQGGLGADDIDEKEVASHLYTHDLYDPDLLIRTSGEMRLSNFLLWQLAYAEIHVTDVRWPDFETDDLMKALEAYAGRQRRFGRTGEQVSR